ncbi:MAG: electron transport complex subunit E [Magnetococcales bacterium]|nr:electron transport complex subunit E [Magnetococcales bacterium]
MSDGNQNGLGKVFIDGLWTNNNIFVQLLGMCPTLAVTTSAENGIGMGLATAAVLLGSNVCISAIRKFIPGDVRIPAFIVVIASFVTIVDLLMNAFWYDLYQKLGIFIPLIVVNCVILGRAEAFASKNGVVASAVDGISMGLGFTLALLVLGGVREVLGSGQFLGMDVVGQSFHPAVTFVLPPGAFIALGFILAGYRVIRQWQDKRAEEAEAARRNAATGGTQPITA